MNKKTVLIGASQNPERYSYLAIKALRKHKHEVIAIGKTEGKVADVDFITENLLISEVDTVSLYVNPTIQKFYYNYILSLHPKRIIFNPGTENKELYALAVQNNILPLEACTLVLLSTSQY